MIFCPHEKEGWVNNRAGKDFEPRGVPDLVASGQGLGAVVCALPAVKGGSKPLSPGVSDTKVTTNQHKEQGDNSKN